MSADLSPQSSAERHSSNGTSAPGKVIRPILLCTLLLSGCFEIRVPYGYEKIQDSEFYVRPEVLAAIKEERLPRADVIARLGEPDAEDHVERAIGYERCVSSSGDELVIWMVPVWSVDKEFAHCQRIGVWFDDEDRALRTKSSTIRADAPAPNCSLLVALRSTSILSQGTCW